MYCLGTGRPNDRTSRISDSLNHHLCVSNNDRPVTSEERSAISVPPLGGRTTGARIRRGRTAEVRRAQHGSPSRRSSDWSQELSGRTAKERRSRKSHTYTVSRSLSFRCMFDSSMDPFHSKPARSHSLSMTLCTGDHSPPSQCPGVTCPPASALVRPRTTPYWERLGSDTKQCNTPI
ncbi:hypothetical protein LR48_Vigan01g051100 [Vigna angularis]|uniref:Uncharacterized protein n=1 Tax=Phaseolus angularis TaxID=3914 RepID=A0A0L9TKG5_PHAAN|nr:hypothetical protein LR48_Vigan01g051100 [Vigna angularis]